MLKFCDECGAPTSATPDPAAPRAPSDATRKTITALFADLVGSTSFGERADAEVARTVLARYHALLQEAIDAHDGTVAKFMGDGMMATFGIPEIAEDDAQRAVNAGMDIQRRFTDFAAAVAAQHAETLGLRVGVNTGEVVIASGDADVIGDALNVAARIEHACRPGQVTVGEETWRLTRGEFGYESLGEVTVAGRAQPVAIFEVAADATTAVEMAAPFVGRTHEMDRLRAVLGTAISARTARLVTVLGSPGVGKTRLSRELCAATEADDDAITFEIRCDRAGGATFGPIAQLIRDATDLGDDTNAESARERLGALLADDEADRDRLVEILGGLVGAAPARSVEETFWAVRRLVSATAVDRPMVVVIDDIQWAEAVLLDLLEHLAEWVQDVPLLLLCLGRPELREVRPSLAERNRRVEDVLALDGLDATATEALAAGLLGTDRLPAGLVERLPTSTDGNPLFVRELVRMLVDDEVIRRRGDEWELAIDAEAVEVPPTIQSLLATRVERLPDEERTLLELASVIGAEFNLGALRELAGQRMKLPLLLESMRRRELVEPTGTYWGDEPMYRFHHVLIRDAAYRRLLKITRADLHEKVAVWADAAAARLIGEHDAVIAFHYEQTYRYRSELGSLDEHVTALGRRAAELLSGAADRALGQDDLAAAGALASRALALLPESDTTARAELLTTACECTLSSGDVAGARPVVEQLRSEAGDDPTLGAWASCFEAQLVGLTDPDGLVGAEAAATGAEKVMEELGDGAGEAKAHQVRAGLLARLGRVGDAELELDLALGAARRVDDRRQVTAVLGAAPLAALWGPSPVARAGGRCLDVVRLLRITTASPSVEATSMRCQAVLEALRGRFDVARSMLDSSRATLEELGLRHGLLETAYLTGVVELVAGDPAAAIAPLRDAYDGLIEMGVGIDAGRAAALLAHALVAEDRIDDAEPMAASSEELAGQDLKTAIAWRVARAEVLAARGDVAGGTALATEAVDIAAATDLVIDHADACVALAALHEAGRDTAAARSVRAEAKRLYDLKGATVPAARLSETVAVTEPEPASTRPDEPRAIQTPAPAPPEPANTWARTPLAENDAATVLAKAWELTVAGRVDEIGLLCAEDAVVFDRQRIIGEDLVGRDAIVANLGAVAALGAEAARVEPLAVRGSRLALGRTTVSFGSFENVFLSVIELDSQGLGRHIVTVDEDSLVEALDELDERYIAGEGAPRADLVRAGREFRQATASWDLDRLRSTMAEDLVVEDHRQLSWGTLDREGYLELQRSYAETLASRDYDMVTRTFHAVGRAILVTINNRAVTTDGMSYEWVFHGVGLVEPGGLTTRLEMFDEDDFAAALARLDELGAAETRAPDAENLATMFATRLWERYVAGQIDECRPLFADDAVLVDKRPIIGTELVGVDAIIANLRAAAEVGIVSVLVEPLAVRGARLALVRFTMDLGTFESVFLGLGAIDARGLCSSITMFDEDALGEAIDELDARYVAGEGAP